MGIGWEMGLGIFDLITDRKFRVLNSYKQPQKH